MSTKLEVAPKTLLFGVLVVIGIWFLVQIQDILKLLFVAFILMSALRPSVDMLERWRVPRILAIIFNYIVVIVFLSLFGTIVFPPLVSETVRLFNNLPGYLVQVLPLATIDINTIIQQIAPIGQNIARLTVGVFSNVVTLLTIAVLTFYFLLERRNLRIMLSTFIGEEMANNWVDITRKVEERLGAWVRGQLLLGLIIGLASYIGLLVLGIPYALPLALVAGLLEMIPIIGPIISAVPAVLIALTLSPGLGLLTALLYFAIQQLENNLLVPMVMQRTVGLPPLASLLALLIGGKLAGVVGILLSVPVLLTLQTILQSLVYKQSSEK